MIVYLVRHGESAVMEWRMSHPNALVVPARFLPDSRVPLSQFGRRQGEALGAYFSELPADLRPTHAFASPYVRTVQTGTLGISGLSIPLKVDRRLREIEFGIFKGLTKKGRASRYPEEWAERRRVGKINYRPAWGENWHDVARRIEPFKAKLLRLPADARVAVFSHEVVINVMRWAWEGADLTELLTVPVPSASVTSYEVVAGTFVLREKYRLPVGPDGQQLYSAEGKQDDR
ncbi:MAG TPA: histidine phosphatase family protein [Candidatus Obscuribacterales bacterium]